MTCLKFCLVSLRFQEVGRGGEIDGGMTRPQSTLFRSHTSPKGERGLMERRKRKGRDSHVKTWRAGAAVDNRRLYEWMRLLDHKLTGLIN